MKKYLRVLFTTFLSMTVIVGCKKSSPGTIVANKAKCTIIGETTALSGNQKSFEYLYDGTGNPTLVKVFRPNGSVESTHETGSTTSTFSSTGSGKLKRRIISYLASDIFSQLPTKAFVSIDDGDILKVNYYTYFFFYDNKGKLIKVGEQTDHVVGDREYDLNIFYNEQENVTGLQYEWTTGPRDIIPPVIVTAYDNKPNPYSAIKGWPFLLINFSWDNYDPEPILTALSKNNPLNYTIGAGTSLFTREMVYQYNNDGFPTERKNTNKNTNGAYTFLQTFSYNCK